MSLWLGVDAVSISRVRKAVERRGDYFLRRLFSADELVHCLGQGDSCTRIAGRFAVKEAVMKALGNAGEKGLSWKDIEIAEDDCKRVTIRIRGALEKKLKELNASSISISLSHDKTADVAVAVAVIF